MKYDEVKNVVDGIKGTTFAGVDTLVEVKLAGGKKNPFQGRVQKKTVGSNVMIFSNTDFSPYKAMVQRRMVAEGKDPTEFELKPRAWGIRVGNSPFIEHNGKHYLEVIFKNAGQSQYFVDGVATDKSEIQGLPEEKEELTESEKESQGGISDKVVVRTYSIDSIVELRVKGTVLN